MFRPVFTRKQLLQLIVPLIIEQILTATVGIADTLMVANVGEAAVSGVSLVDSVNMLMINIFAALATGGAVVVCQYLGMKEPDRALKAASQMFWVSLALSVTVCAVFLFFRVWLLRFIFGRVAADVMQNALVYFFITALSYPFIAQYNTCAALFRASGNSKVPMLVSLIINIIHIGGNALFIYAMGMGAAGAALSTLITRTLGAAALFILLRGGRYELNLSKLLPFHLDFRMIKNILYIGAPIALENGIFQIGKISVSSMIAAFGTADIAANAVANSVTNINIMPAAAMGIALVTVAGRCAGAGEFGQCKRYMIKLTLAAQVSVVALSLPIVLAMDPIVRLYGLSPEAAVLAKRIILWLCCVSSVLWPAGFVMPNGLRACSDVKFSMLVAISSMWTMRVGMGYVLSTVLGFGVIGVWWGMFMDWTVRVILYGWRFLSGRWTRQRIAA